MDEFVINKIGKIKLFVAIEQFSSASLIINSDTYLDGYEPNMRDECIPYRRCIVLKHVLDTYAYNTMSTSTTEPDASRCISRLA